jgi:hypothetical protein
MSQGCPCVDCRQPTAPCTHRRGCRHVGKWEYYMVWNDVWEAAGLPHTSSESVYACIGCLERRLGRQLTRADFRSDVPLNSADHPWHTPRLRARLTTKRSPRRTKAQMRRDADIDAEHLFALIFPDLLRSVIRDAMRPRAVLRRRNSGRTATRNSDS